MQALLEYDCKEEKDIIAGRLTTNTWGLGESVLRLTPPTAE